MRHQDDVSIELIRKLDDAGIRYMVVGSHAVFLYGEPRTTHLQDGES